MINWFYGDRAIDTELYCTTCRDNCARIEYRIKPITGQTQFQSFCACGDHSPYYDDIQMARKYLTKDNSNE